MVIKNKDTEYCKTTGDVARLLQKALGLEDEIDQEKEHFWVIHLNGRLRVKCFELVSLGSMETAVIHPREIYRRAVANGTSQIIIGHNHPSGEVEPSEDDLEITHRLKKAGDILGVTLLDHIIIGTGAEEYFSFEEKGLIEKEGSKK